MGKRSTFQHTRDQRDKAFWLTPAAATQALLDVLPAAVIYAEPCAGQGHLIEALRGAGHRCGWASDAFPSHDTLARTPKIHEADACSVQLPAGIDVAITNPPFGKVMEDIPGEFKKNGTPKQCEVFNWTPTRDAIIDNLSKQVPTWLLLPLDFLGAQSSARFVPWVTEIATIGRVKWIEDSKWGSTDNFCWFQFDQQHPSETVRIHPQKARP